MNLKKYTAGVLLTAAAALLCAAVPGNLLLNSEMKLNSFKNSRLPEYWGSVMKFTLLPKGGPHGEAVLQMKSPKGTFSQANLKLFPGEQYKIGAWIRTKDYKSRRSVFGIWNRGWTKAVYTDTFPDTAGKWVKVEKIVTMPESVDRRYNFGFYSPDWKGSLEISSPFIVPHSPKAAAAHKEEGFQLPAGAVLKRKMISAPLSAKAPVLDGKPDEAVWKQASEFSDFALFRKNTPAKLKTQVKLLYTADALYLGISCFDPKGVTDPGKVTGSGVWKGDLVEIFFGPLTPERRLSQFVVGAGGALYTGDGKTTAHMLMRQKITNTIGPWEAKTRIGKNVWYAEVKIPFKTLGWKKAPRKGEVIPFNIARQSIKSKETSSWSTLIRRKFLEVPRYGRVIFGSYADGFKALYKKNLAPNTRAACEKESFKAEERVMKKRFAQLKAKVLLAPVNITDDFTVPYIPEEIFTPPRKIALRAAVNEIKPLLLAVANNTDKVREYRVAVEADSSRWYSRQPAEGLKNFPAVTMRQGVRFREHARGGRTIYDPLPEMNQAKTLLIPPRQAALVWIDFNTKGVKPGKYAGRIIAVPLGGKGAFQKGTALLNPYQGDLQSVPLELTVMNFKLPEAPVKDMTLYSSMPTKALVKHYEELGCRVFDLSVWNFIFPRGKDGNLVCSAPQAEKDIRFFQQEAARYGYRPKFHIVYTADEFCARVYKNDPAAWEKWLKTLDKFMTRMGVRKNEWWVELHDEPWSKEMGSVNEHAIRGRKAVADLPFFITTVVGRILKPEELYKVKPHLSRWVFHRRDFSSGPEWKEFIRKIKKTGVPVGHYTCEVELDSSLAENYRRTAWFTEYAGLDAHHLYQGVRHGYNGKATIDFKTSVEGTLLYVSFNDVIPSLRSMAVRQGVTDTKYIALLRQMSKKHPEAAAFVEKALKNVIEKFPHDHTMPDRMREQAADLILKLKK